jgi:hypothetical protein
MGGSIFDSCLGVKQLKAQRLEHESGKIIFHFILVNKSNYIILL